VATGRQGAGRNGSRDGCSRLRAEQHCAIPPSAAGSSGTCRALAAKALARAELPRRGGKLVADRLPCRLADEVMEMCGSCGRGLEQGWHLGLGVTEKRLSPTTRLSAFMVGFTCNTSGEGLMPGKLKEKSRRQATHKTGRIDRSTANTHVGSCARPMATFRRGPPQGHDVEDAACRDRHGVASRHLRKHHK